MRVLIFCPTTSQRPLVHRATINAIMNLDWPRCEVVFGREDHEERSRDAKHADLYRKQMRARNLALMGSYDAMLMVEADIIIPPNALTRLIETGAGVAYGLYCSRNPDYGHNWLLDTEAGSYEVEPASKDKSFRKNAWGKVVESQGHGFGCTLIRREVLQQVPFRFDNTAVASDWWFALDCQKAKIPQVHHCGVLCGHVNGKTILWPHREETYWWQPSI